MSDAVETSIHVDYSSLGFVDGPFTDLPDDGSSYWARLVANAASNRLLTAVKRARTGSRPALVRMSDGIPDYYYRVAMNDLLARTASEPELGVMALNIPLEMMRLGRIRGTLAELAELVVAVDMPVTIAKWYLTALQAPAPDLPEAALVTDEEVEAARTLFESDPGEAVARFFGFDAEPLSENEMDVVVHEAYLRQLAQPVEVEKAEEPVEEAPAEFVAIASDTDAELSLAQGAVENDSANMREYLLALARTLLSPVVARALLAFGRYGESMTAQEFKITKAPRKTLAALLRFMSARWGNIVVIYDSFEPWPMLDQKARVDVLASLTELRYITAECGVMVICVNEGTAPEIEEQFAAAEPVDWTLPEVLSLSRGEHPFNADWVQSWLDAASLTGVSALRADGPELAPLVDACEGDLLDFALMAHAALRDAAARALSTPDAASIAVGVAALEGDSHR